MHALITGKEYVVTVLLGKPGEGKSAILARLGTRLSGENTILLAIKADQIPRKVETLDDLDKWIDCPISIVEALRRLAAVRRVVVLIDQLDALAELMDQHSERLSALFRLVGAISNTPNLHVIMSCREFEFRNDVRLATLKAESIMLSPLAWDQVSPLLTTHQLDVDNWNEEVREVLRTPQHLAVFLSYLASSQKVPTFSSYQGLLDRVVKDRLEQSYGTRTVEAAERIAGEMAQEEELWLARDRFELEFSDELKNLKAAEFLVSSENDLSIAFRHQTLFDFLRARSFLRQQNCRWQSIRDCGKARIAVQSPDPVERVAVFTRKPIGQFIVKNFSSTYGSIRGYVCTCVTFSFRSWVKSRSRTMKKLAGYSPRWMIRLCVRKHYASRRR